MSEQSLMYHLTQRLSLPCHLFRKKTTVKPQITHWEEDTNIYKIRAMNIL